MSDTATVPIAHPEEPAQPTPIRTVVAASAAGTTFEWYDFFIYGTLAPVIGKLFLPADNATAGFIFALLTFGVGFAMRPLGALAFGWIGDRSGRKAAFILTIALMGLATFAIGLLPTYSQAGLLAPVLLVVLRMVQGFALGGEYGGAAIYVAEHAETGARGRLTGWIQTSAAFGLMGALSVILLTRSAMGETAFTADAWLAGWRIPFLVSLALLGLSLWIRAKLGESPAFAKLHAEGGTSKAPFRESFGEWPNLKLVLIAFFAIMAAQGAVWYTAFFYAQFFLEKVAKVAPPTVNVLMIAATAVSAVLYVVFGHVSDKIGRKPVMVGGMILAVVAFFPGFQLMTRAANPALVEAQARAPVTVVADPADCSLLFDPVGKRVFTSSCDVARKALADAGIPYRNAAAPAGTPARVEVAGAQVASLDGAGLDAAAFKAARTGFDTRLKAALTQAGYPAAADPTRVNLLGVLACLLVFVVAATALYGPIAACLVELFPTRVRYTAMSLPYHIGTGWIGGFLPFIAFAIVAATGDIYSGLWWSVGVTVVSIASALLFLPETRGRDLEA